MSIPEIAIHKKVFHQLLKLNKIEILNDLLQTECNWVYTLEEKDPYLEEKDPYRIAWLVIIG